MQVKLKVLVGKTVGKDIVIPVKHFLIGRAEECHLRPKSDSISRNHCVILTHEDTVLVRDLNSRNGTFVNGQRVTGDVELKSGDHLQLGKLEFEVSIRAKTPKLEVPAPAAQPVRRNAADSFDFDITEWLEEGNSATAAKRRSEPETRQFQLDETDRHALAQAAEADAADAGDEEKSGRLQKREPGKLPQRPDAAAANSREAAADMLRKFFHNR